ncbi:hypothetical protein ALC56_10790, partial [Trachymyrmex septentrionalis]
KKPLFSGHHAKDLQLLYFLISFKEFSRDLQSLQLNYNNA